MKPEDVLTPAERAERDTLKKAVSEVMHKWYNSLLDVEQAAYYFCVRATFPPCMYEVIQDDEGGIAVAFKSHALTDVEHFATFIATGKLVSDKFPTDELMAIAAQLRSFTVLAQQRIKGATEKPQ